MSWACGTGRSAFPRPTEEMNRKRTTLYFDSTHGRYGGFSNFARYPVKIGGVVWPTTEHYFQAQKFKDPRRREAIRRAKTPWEAARLGRNRRWRLRPDWESVKIQVMREAVAAKFEQHRELADILIDTGASELVERSDKDAFWGNGGDGRGRNELGKILMQVRLECQRARHRDAKPGSE